MKGRAKPEKISSLGSSLIRRMKVTSQQTARIRVIDGNPEALEQILKILSVPVGKFRFYGNNLSDRCNGTVVHVPHEMEKGAYCMGRSGFVGEQAFFIVASERSLLSLGSAKGIFFWLPRSVFPGLGDPLVKAGVGQGPGYVEGGGD